MRITSTSLALADWMPSNTTEAGSAPSCWRTMDAPLLPAQISSWSAAAARKVSPATSMTFFP